MEKIISYDNLRNFAYSNDKLISGKVRGIAVSFTGLGGGAMHDTDPDDAYVYAEHGIILVVPYNNPWAWMNRQAVSYTDEIIAVLCEKYGLDDKVKVVSLGYSMGGLSAIVYCAYASVTPCACVVNCPVCDLPYHFTERPDLPRTLYSAFFGYECTLDEALKSASPMHLIDKLPEIPYTIFHCEEDKAVNIDRHSRTFVNAMKWRHSITLKTIPDRGHCDLTPEAKEEYLKTVITSIEN